MSVPLLPSHDHTAAGRSSFASGESPRVIKATRHLGGRSWCARVHRPFRTSSILWHAFVTPAARRMEQTSSRSRPLGSRCQTCQRKSVPVHRHHHQTIARARKNHETCAGGTSQDYSGTNSTMATVADKPAKLCCTRGLAFNPQLVSRMTRSQGRPHSAPLAEVNTGCKRTCTVVGRVNH